MGKQQFSTDEVMDMVGRGMSQYAIAEHFGVCRSAITKRVGRRMARIAKNECKDEPQKPEEREECSVVDINGIFPSDHEPHPDAIWARLIEEQHSIEDRIARKYAQSIVIHDTKPVCIAMLSDKHIGNSFCDYRNMKEDAELIAATEGMYAIEAGDTCDNWVGKLEGMQRWQKMDFDAERALVRWYLECLSHKLLAVCSGNHENRTRKIAGIDSLREIIRDCHVLYDRHEVGFTIQLGSASWRVKLRHQWPGRSIYNQTHGMERDARFVNVDWDIAIGGHDHSGTLFREFAHSGRKKLCIQIGTYKMYDGYGMELNCAESIGSGCGAITLFPDGRIQQHSDLVMAAEFLKFARRYQ